MSLSFHPPTMIVAAAMFVMDINRIRGSLTSQFQVKVLVYMQVGNSCSDTPIKGKAACTKFTRISTNGIHSLVLCEPVTGRTHQVSDRNTTFQVRSIVAP